GSHDGRHEPRLVREGPEGPAEGKRGIAVTLLQWPEADPAGFATQCQRLARTPALGLQARPPVKAQILWQEPQDDGMELHGACILPGLFPRVESFFSHPAERLWYAGRILRMKGASHEAGRNCGGVGGVARKRYMAERAGLCREGVADRGRDASDPRVHVDAAGQDDGGYHVRPGAVFLRAWRPSDHFRSGEGVGRPEGRGQETTDD